jgi:hypothetical protein
MLPTHEGLSCNDLSIQVSLYLYEIQKLIEKVIIVSPYPNPHHLVAGANTGTNSTRTLAFENAAHFASTPPSAAGSVKKAIESLLQVSDAISAASNDVVAEPILAPSLAAFDAI